jgi:RimJ/RimL family protein N-acetyltransferase
MKTATTPTLSGKQIELRPLTEDDASDVYVRWLNDPEVNKFLETRSVTVEELRSYIREKNASSKALFLGIFWKENGQHIGNVKLEPIDWKARTAVLGILIGEKAYWGRGVGTEAIRLVEEHTFNELGLRELTLGVISTHVSAICLYEKCGFVICGIEKDAVDHDGQLFDRTLMRKTSLLPRAA